MRDLVLKTLYDVNGNTTEKQAKWILKRDVFSKIRSDFSNEISHIRSDIRNLPARERKLFEEALSEHKLYLRNGKKKTTRTAKKKSSNKIMSFLRKANDIFEEMF